MPELLIFDRIRPGTSPSPLGERVGVRGLAAGVERGVSPLTRRGSEFTETFARLGRAGLSPGGEAKWSAVGPSSRVVRWA